MAHPQSHPVCDIPAGRQRPASASRRAFTLIELLVSLAIIALLLSLLAPGISAVRKRSRQFECKMNLRAVAFDFGVYADPALKGTRGDDDTKSRLTGNEFWLETFQQSQYRIDEFWDWSDGVYRGHVRDLGVMACPEVNGEIILRDESTCRQGAVAPPRNVSFAFNYRLDSVETKRGGMWGLEARPLTDRILSEPGMIPLLFDVDGAEAEKRQVIPHYSAPPLADRPDAPYSSGLYWFPAERHMGETQVAFVSGEVLSFPDIGPEAQPGWRWDYQPK